MWTLLLCIFCFLTCIENRLASSNVGNETSLRQNIAALNKGTLNFSNQNVPYDKSELSDTTPKNQSAYDFIVIGAGSAGSAIASRLTEIEGVTVLLIEAGGKEYSIVDIPALAIPLQFSNEINWKYETESSDLYCLGLKDHRSKWPRGKLMGGSSSNNYMLAMRGNRQDYDEWANITNDISWSYINMLKYLKKVENFTATNIPVDPAFHNRNGPLHITGPVQRTEFTDAFIKAGKQMGYSEVDYRGVEQTGFAYFQSALYKGERWSNNRAYLRPAKGRRNLVLTQNSLVHKILIDKSTKTAYGVRYFKNGFIYEVKAKKEVILSAGSINSPQILMLSGVGPAKHLQDFNIDVIKDAPVGENLIDHVGYMGLTFRTNDTANIVDMNFTDSKNPAIKNYLESRTGLLASGLSLGGVAYVNVDDDSDIPNLELLYNQIPGIKDPMFADAVGVSDKYKKKLLADKPNTTMYMTWPLVLKPRSRGKILLRSNNPLDKPKIYANYFEDHRDVEVLIKGIRLAIRLSKTPAFQKYASELYEVPLPCDNHEKDSDEYWECAVTTFTGTVYHLVGTCKMGREEDRTSVVNSQLKVIGVEGLRVVDCSVLPDIIRGHTNIPCTAVAEKAFDIIKRDHGLL